MAGAVLFPGGRQFKKTLEKGLGLPKLDRQN